MPSSQPPPSTSVGPGQRPARPIVVALDGMPPAQHALRFAAGWAQRLDVPLHAITAENLGEYSADRAALLRGEAERRIDKAVQTVQRDHPGVTVTGEVAWSSPIPALMRAAEYAGAIVLGSRSVTGWRGVVLGSVAAAISAEAPCAVVVLPRLVHDTSARGSVVVGVDGSPESVEAAAFAMRQAAAFSTTVTAVSARRAVPLVGPTSGGSGTERTAEQRAALTATLRPLREAWPDVPVEERCLVGSPAEELADLSRDAVMVVVGSRGRGAVKGRVLGSTSRELLVKAHSPVAVIRPGDAVPG